MSERNLKETLSLLQRRALRADKQLGKLRAQRLRLEQRIATIKRARRKLDAVLDSFEEEESRIRRVITPKIRAELEAKIAHGRAAGKTWNDLAVELSWHRDTLMRVWSVHMRCRSIDDDVCIAPAVVAAPAPCKPAPPPAPAPVKPAPVMPTPPQSPPRRFALPASVRAAAVPAPRQQRTDLRWTRPERAVLESVTCTPMPKTLRELLHRAALLGIEDPRGTVAEMLGISPSEIAAPETKEQRTAAKELCTRLLTHAQKELGMIATSAVASN